MIQGSPIPLEGPLPLTNDVATVKFSQKSVTVWPGFTQSVIVTITAPKGGDPATLPVYSGFIVASDGAETYHATYLGAAASLKDFQTLDNTDFFFGEKLPAILDGANNFVAGPRNWTFAGEDFPAVLTRQLFGSPLVRFDLVAADIKLVPSVTRREDEARHVFERSLFSFPWWPPVKGPGGGSFAQVKVKGPLAQFNYIPRNGLDENVSIRLVSV